MKLRFASWNVNNRRLRLSHLELIRKTEADVLALQEVHPQFHSALAKENLFSLSACSLTMRPPGPGDGLDRHRGCSLFAKPPFQSLRPSLLDGCDFPEQTLIAEARCPGGTVTVCSFHTPPGASHGIKKGEFLKSIAEWLSPREAATIFGIDANTPKFERPNIEKNVWWPRKYEPWLLGGPKDCRHKLRDTLRVYLSANPELMARVPRQGPLAVSYRRGVAKVPCRYDFIYVTPDIGVERVNYLYDESIKAGSDHGMVVADLEI